MDAAAPPTQQGIIYILTSPSGKSYVGQTKQSLLKRVRAHFSMARANSVNSIIYHSIRKYGEKNIAVRVIEICPLDELDGAEKFWIEILGTLSPNGYNTRTGGSSGYTYTPDVLEKMALANKGRVRPQFERDKISKTMLGVPKSEETRERMRAAQRGTHPSDKCIAASLACKRKPVIGTNILTGETKLFGAAIDASAFLGKNRTFAHSYIYSKRTTKDGWKFEYAPRS